MSAVVSAIVAAAAITTTATIHQSNMARKSAKSQAEAQISREKAAAEKLQLAQSTASSQAQARISQRKRAIAAGGRTIRTNPLGIGGTASVAKKKLLGE